MEDAALSILDLELHRLHYTYSLIDQGTVREDYRYIFRNRGKVSHSAVPLLWRRREVQANMTVLDASNSNLVYLPSESNRAVILRYIELLLEPTRNESEGSKRLWSEMDKRALWRHVDRALDFESSLEDREEAYRIVTEISNHFPEVDELIRLKTHLGYARQYYMPLAVLDTPVEPNAFVFVRHGVDLYAPVSVPNTRVGVRGPTRPISLRQFGRFLVSFRFNFAAPLPLDAPAAFHAKSLHCRVSLPPGLRVVPGAISLEPQSVFRDLATLSLSSHDDRNVYFYLGTRDIDVALQNRDVEVTRRLGMEENLEAAFHELRSKFSRLRLPGVVTHAWKNYVENQREVASRVSLEVQVPVAPARGTIPLVGLLWLVALVGIVASLLGLLNLDRFLSVLALLLVTVVSIAVFALEKSVLRELVIGHSILAVAAVIVAYTFSNGL